MCPSPSLAAAEPTAALRSGEVGALGEHGPVGILTGTELVGQFQGTGYREPPQLVARSDGQIVRLPQLLYLVVVVLAEAYEKAQPENSAGGGTERVLAEVAQRVGEASGLLLGRDHIVFLLDRKLAPLGITTFSDGTSIELERPTPALGLRVRMTLLSARGTWVIGGLFGWLFQPLVQVLMVLAIVAAEAWALATQDLSGAMRDTIAQPAGILVIVVLAIVSTAIHEFGHAAACRYSGAAPGVMGCGLYLVWPAFFTDVTNSYRLSRAGRIRTDLGGVYFNGLCLLVLTGLYASTGYAPLLVAVLTVNLEIIQQLLPTLRFDGYYIVSDLVGIPDLFKFIRPIISRTVLRRPADEQLSALKRWPQVLVTAWVLLIVPALALQLGYIFWQLPDLVRADWVTIIALVGTADGGSPVLNAISTTVRILLLLLPLIGIALVLFQLARGIVVRAGRLLRDWSTTHPQPAGLVVIWSGAVAVVAALSFWILLPGDSTPPSHPASGLTAPTQTLPSRPSPVPTTETSSPVHPPEPADAQPPASTKPPGSAERHAAHEPAHSTAHRPAAPADERTTPPPAASPSTGPPAQQPQTPPATRTSPDCGPLGLFVLLSLCHT
ncbi:hypothetical protein [Amycolatopsis sp. PS_44_ISF1]|uniref:hypothetical protein n=1 Tax=Amycolatopsis sp. PS_44_ISF1 TaxID=2974917 RepID=UPI0028E07B35|nr:hypothetical protein [Amycolatopsis sp. PS_44_ISF1]MDT8912021.1 hypothetical protein [Amycolatopsis sp. PS_44_ISF1]MDT8913716.1 hypothetical protein [Amycolatopsis sp. PS_44_ISF1]